MLKHIVACAFLIVLVAAEPPPVQGIRPSNVLGGAEQHASFSFVRPGLTQTSYSFNGPSSHQAFSSSIGNPHLAQRVLPNVANALAYRNPGLGYFQTGPAATAYAHAPVPAGVAEQAPLVYQGPVPAQGPLDQATALAYQQQYQQLLAQQQYQQLQAQSAQVQQYPEAAAYQAQLTQLLALRQAQAQAQAQTQAQAQVHQVPEQIQLQQRKQQEQQTQNLLGVAYSAAPSVAHVKVNGNGYKFDF